MKDPRDIILAPVVSEKSYAHFNHSVVAASMKTRRFKINDRIGFLHCLSPNPPV